MISCQAEMPTRECVGAWQAARARSAVTSRQRGRSASEGPAPVDGASTRGTLAPKTDDRTCRSLRHTQVRRCGGERCGDRRQAVWCRERRRLASANDATRRPTRRVGPTGAIGAVPPPGGRKREGPSPGWAETAPAGSGRQSRLGPGPKGRAFPEVRRGRHGPPCPAFRVGRQTGNGGRRLPRPAAPGDRSPRGRERAGCEAVRGGRGRSGMPWRGPSARSRRAAYDRLHGVKGARPAEAGRPAGP